MEYVQKELKRLEGMLRFWRFEMLWGVDAGAA
jgi:hypothetical protein